MRVEDAIRKIRLLLRLVPQNGASESEAETARHLAQVLMQRYSIGTEEVDAVQSPRSRMTWVYWENLLAELGITLERLGGRASAALGSGAVILIRLADGRWQVQEMSVAGWKIAVRDFGLETLRSYLANQGPRAYSLVS